MRPRSHPDLAVVTGAFSYTGRYVARRLIDQGVRVRTLTRHRVQAAPLDFSDPEGLRRSMQGAGVLYNTYWIRFPRGQTGFEHAVQNTRTLFDAAVRAGVERVVHLSVSNASLDSRLPYIRAKAQTEEMLEGFAVPCVWPTTGSQPATGRRGGGQREVGAEVGAVRGVARRREGNHRPQEPGQHPRLLVERLVDNLQTSHVGV